VVAVHVRFGHKTWIYEKLWEIKTALNGTWKDVLEYLLTNRANIVLPPIKIEGGTRPRVVFKRIKTLKYIHEFRASARKPWLDKYLGRNIFSLYTHYNNMSCKLLFTREGEDIVIIDTIVATPPLSPSEYAKGVEILLRAILVELNKICSYWNCERITVEADATPYLSYLLEILREKS
jgi:hypothetical protein